MTEDAELGLGRNAPLQAVLDTLPEHVAIVTGGGTVSLVNEAWRRFGRENGGCPEHIGVASNYFEVCQRATGSARSEARAALHGMQAVMGGALPQFSLEYACKTPTELLWFKVTVTPLFSGSVIVSHANVSEQKRYVDMAYTDPLTGVANRRLFMDFATQALAAAARNGHQVALVMADLNGFKGVNDSYGHDVGDALLVAFAERLRGVFRRGDVVARLGGDEFAAVLSLRNTAALNDALIRDLRHLNEPYALRGRTFEVKTSLGVALFPRHSGDLRSLLRCVDAALYQAKRRGVGLAFYGDA
ncbi:MAG: diguanylate cyclase/phosphodiesterase (GGDEF & EAL domains) with PAS/PAC sensor(s) [uncultured Truepera sp.]|uniref:Diguanylate cyclase/phosphodiesterase (GGDEF & EAL domains) with PAS/PAC sensor(S) n=1 Tax=uncultured Truepera sp. TaxID=543023 RepID=A0A6J4VPY6_9DEIN|nr:MAG: diguanylate cyclase/phosphodiesterase (GGDEF & EAL domains) with PAS/PAC sensor(s) [uncultured Truepera sp.]